MPPAAFWRVMVLRFDAERIMKLNTILMLAFPILATALSQAASYGPSSITPPPPVREFRAAWVATVANIDWPSKRGLPVADQKAELMDILDRAAALKLNAVIFQVRPRQCANSAPPG